MQKKCCSACGEELPNERPYDTCISCTPQGKRKVLMGMCNKTGLHVAAVIDPTDQESLRLASLSSNCVIRRKFL